MMHRSRHIGMVLAMAIVVASAPAVHAVVLVRNAKQLSQQRSIKQWQPLYEALAAATVVYDQCADFYTITDVQRDYLKTLFLDTTNGYIQAYYDDYVQRVHFIPDQKFMDEVTKILRKQQQRVVNQTAGVIQERGCRDKGIRKILTYPEQYRYISQPGIQNPGEE
jgi:hypothetical protein